MKRKCIKIELLEDLHVGMGTGYGDIDALQVRDRRGWPVLPASHLKGLWREVALQVSKDEAYRLFGRAGDQQGQVQLTSAYVSKPVRTLVWGSTAIDDRGKAEERSLRFIEYVPAGTSFELHVCAPEEDWPVLEKTLARCSRLGGGRQRGYGRIRWKIQDQEYPTLTLHNTPIIHGRLRLQIKNLDPLCLPRTGHPGNLIASDAFIRGRALRGAMVAACLAGGHEVLAQGLLSETLCWGDAFPVPQEDFDLAQAEVIPIPLSIGTPKAKASGELPWWAECSSYGVLGSRGEINQIIALNVPPKDKLKRPKDDEFLFRAREDLPWQRYRPQMFERLHTRVPSTENGFQQALFSTEEIAEHSVFLADLLVTSTTDTQTLCEALQRLSGQWLRVGRGGRPVIIEAAEWLPIPQHGESQGEGFTLGLTSDLIVRDSWGNYCDCLTDIALSHLLGEEANTGEDWRIERNFSEARDIFGFNALTGLPRQAQRAIKAGSVVRIEGPGSIRLRERLSQFLVLGESPEEGFGRFLIDVPPLPSTVPVKAKDDQRENESEELCRQAKQWVDDFGQVLMGPSPSQWGEWRSHIQAARDTQELIRAFSLLEAAKDKYGGKPWKRFVEHKAFALLRQMVVERPFEEMRLLLEFFLRWQRVAKTDGKESMV